MSKPKYTPGPWTVAHSGYLNQCAIGPSIGVAYGAGEELYANANLIAAAPDMYEALESYPGLRASPDEFAAWIVKVDAAVRKAHGQ